MAHKKAVSLLSDISAAGAGDWKKYEGGPSVLVVFGTFPTTATLEYQGKDGSTAIVISTPTAAGFTSIDLPQGYYRFNLTGGSPSGFYADIVPLDY